MSMRTHVATQSLIGRVLPSLVSQEVIPAGKSIEVITAGMWAAVFVSCQRRVVMLW